MMVKKKKYILIALILLAASYMMIRINRDNRPEQACLDVQNELSYQMDVWDWQTDAPSYSFFSNANQWHYDLTHEMDPAGIIIHYTKEKNLEEEEWELRKMYTRWNENKEYVSTAFVRSESGRELYLYIEEMGKFLVIADIVKGNDLNFALGDNDYSYDSSIPWYSYQERFQEDGDYAGYLIESEWADIYDDRYIAEGALAMADFLDAHKADKKEKWELVNNKVYIGVNGYLADLWYSNGTQRVHIVIDVWNKQYAVIEVIDEIHISASNMRLSVENSQLLVDAPKEITLQNNHDQRYKIVKDSKKFSQDNFLEYSVVDYPRIEFADEEANKEISEKINQLFYEVAMLNYNEKLEQEINAFYSCDYFITYADEDYISIYFVESISSGMSSVTTCEEAVTVSLKTGDKVSLDSFGDIDIIMKNVDNYKGTIYTDAIFEVEDWEENKGKLIEQWKRRESSNYYGYYLYDDRIGFLFDYYRTGRMKIALEFQGIR